MEDRGYMCGVCQKEFSGCIPAKQHFSSRAHQDCVKRAQQMSDIRPHATSPFSCSICHVFVNSQEILRKHIASPRHLEKERRSKSLNTAYSNDNSASYAGPSQSGAGDYVGKPYDFDGIRGICHVCNVELSSCEMAQQHINGEKHRKKEASLKFPGVDQVTSSQDLSNKSCNACAVVFSGPRNAEQHFASEKHRKIVASIANPSHDSGNKSCNACAVVFSGPGNAEQHFASEKHKKIVASIANPSHDSGIKSCNACGVVFSGPHNAEQHFASEKHKKNMASMNSAVETQEWNHTISTLSEPSYYPTENLVNIPPSNALGHGVDKTIDFDGNIGWCHLCSIALTSPEHFRDHKMGAKHKKLFVRFGEVPVHQVGANHVRAVQKLNDTKLQKGSATSNEEYVMHGTRGYCNVCRLELTSVEHFTQHTFGKAHAKAKLKWVAKEQAVGQEFPATSPGRFQGPVSPLPRVSHSSGSDSSAMQGPLNSSQYREADPVFVLGTNIPVLPDGRPEYTFCNIRNTGNCNLCSVNLTSRANAVQHLIGKNHTKTRERSWNPLTSCTTDTISQDTKLYCKLCNAPFSGEGNAMQHYSSEKHKKRERESKPGCDGDYRGDAPTYVPKPTPVGSGYEGSVRKHSPTDSSNRGGVPMYSPAHRTTGQYPCFVCGCYLNTNEELSIHEQSIEHKTTTEGLNSLGFQETLLISGNTQTKDRFVRRNTGSFNVGQSTMLPSVLQIGSDANTNSSEVKFENLHFSSYGNLDPLHFNQPNSNFSTEIRTEDFDETDVKSVFHSGDFDHNNLNSNNNATSSQNGKEIYKSGFVTEVCKSSTRLPESPESHSVSFSSPASRTPPSSESSCSSSHSSFDSRGSAPFLGYPQSQIPAHNLLSNDSSHSFNAGRDRSSYRIRQNQIPAHELLSSDSSLSYVADSGPSSGGRQQQVPVLEASNSNGPSSEDNHLPTLDAVEDFHDRMPELESFCLSISELKIKKDLHDSEKHVTDVSGRKQEIQKVEITTINSFGLPRKPIIEADIDGMPVSTRGGQDGGMTRRGVGSYMARATKNRTSRRRSGQDLLSDDPDKDSDSSSNERTLSAQHSSEDYLTAGQTTSEYSTTHTAVLYPNPTHTAVSSPNPTHTAVSSPNSKVVLQQAATTTTMRRTNDHIAVRQSYNHFCEVCCVPMDTHKALQDHLKGRLHRQKLAKEPAVVRHHPPLVKQINAERVQVTMETQPRGYQLELFHKVMAGDRICFLPTGTGKTLIACMAISAMLECNPSRQALFVVTKVLLVLQQAKYIRQQLGTKVYRRFDPDDPSKMVDRKLRIAELCGGQQSTGGVPLWQHDVIIVTAAFCENMLTRNIVRWEDQCLVVFDEAHHCTKHHPYNNLMMTHHHKMVDAGCCKVLGLTASPAGKTNFSMTVDMLRQLQINMGDSQIAIVKDKLEELTVYMSNAQIHVEVMETTSSENQFLHDLKLYFLQCYMRLAAETVIPEHSDLGLSGIRKPNLTSDDLDQCARDLTRDVVDELDALIDVARPKLDSMDERFKVQNLISHAKCICMAINMTSEVGVMATVMEMQELMATNLNRDFDFAKQIGLPCEHILRTLEMHLSMQKSNLYSAEHTTQPEMSSSVKCLIKQLIYGNYVQWSGTSDRSDRQPLALVLVKQRSTATSLNETLKSHPEITQRNLAVEKMVGHGAGSAERGMTVPQQRKTLDDIKDHKYQIVIATAVAEEGIDLPECELVVSMNPPSTMTALVQMRGRARKLHSHFVIVCNDSKEKTRLGDLLVREENMIKAANFLVQNQNRQATL